MKKKSRYIIIIFIIGFSYIQAHISIWGFNIPKNELSDVIITTKENSYMITDSNLVLELTKEVSKMKKLNKIVANNYPLSKDNSTKFIKILVQTKNKGTYGGSFWNNDNSIVFDSNGYYWSTSKNLFDLMDKSLQHAKKLY
ncbi:MAG: hypothetical protein LIR50_02130 [Bacillota bacterium]|nr:hypothetical protein [Bacillota bacterium]